MIELHFSVGMDAQGDACLYLQRLDTESAHFASESELAELADALNEFFGAKDAASANSLADCLNRVMTKRLASKESV